MSRRNKLWIDESKMDGVIDITAEQASDLQKRDLIWYCGCKEMYRLENASDTEKVRSIIGGQTAGVK